MPRKILSSTMLSAGSASAVSPWFELTELRNATAYVRVSATAATLSGTLTFRGTNFDTQLAAEPALTNTALLTAAPAGFTLSNGVLTVASPAIGTYTIGVTWPTLPKWLLTDWVFTSGGGTVSVAVAISGWS